MYGVNPTWGAQTNEGRTHIATKGVVQSGLVLNLDAGVLSSYPGSGTTWTDLSGNGRNGTLANSFNSFTYSSANGGSIVFGGGIEYISLPENSINSNADFTLNFWVNHSPIIVGFERYYPLLGHLASNALSLKYVTSGSGSGSITTLQLDKSNVLMGNFGGFSFPNNTTNFITITLTKSTNTWSLYANGSFISSFVNSQTFDITLPVLGTTSGSSNFKGNMYSFFYYNRVLTATEIQQNYLATKSRYFS